jgi:hypothetical protein
MKTLQERKEVPAMTTIICVTTDCPFSSVVHRRLDEIAERIPCVAKYFSLIGEIFVECQPKDAAYVERMLADLV